MRRVFIPFAVILGLCVGAAAIAGLALGFWFSDGPLDKLGLERDRAVTFSSQGQSHLYRRDHWGLRGEGIDPARIAVLTLGGGGTDQPQLPEEQTWQAVMARELRAMGRQTEIANAGIDGQSTAGHLRAFHDWFPQVPGLKPRFIVMDVGFNDEMAASGPAVQAEEPRRHGVLIRLLESMFGHSGTEAVPQPYPPVDFATAQWTAQPALAEDCAAMVQAYKDRLAALAQAAHAMGAVPAFVTQVRGDYKLVNGKPWGVVAEVPGGGNGIDRYRALSAFNQATREVCRDQGLLCLDLAREMVFETGDFHDYLHNSAQGADKIGRWMAGKLAGLV